MADAAATAAADLTARISPFLDRHLVFPLLEFLQDRGVYAENQVLRAKIELLAKTNMVDYAMDIHKMLHKTSDVPQEMVARRGEVFGRLKDLEDRAAPVIGFLQNPALVQELRQDKAYNLAMLAEKYQNFASPLNQLQQRTWLMHWSLFVFFNHENGRNAIIDLFFQDRYMNAIQTNAHHLLRYLAVAVIVNKRRRNVLKDLIKVIQQESYVFQDPITEFVEALFINYDFEGAQQKLRECEDALMNDFFIMGKQAQEMGYSGASFSDEFIENARLFIFETYCRIHQCIDIRMLSEKLNMSADEAERWIVNLIRNAKLDAKIDSKNSTVVMGTQHTSVYEVITERTKGLAMRSYQLANSVASVAPLISS
eukprot:SM000133S26787  [mRNA]  locus=s133:94362:97145:+ [translate_table: standard]